MELLDLLQELRNQGGSDFHLMAGSVPRLRIDGSLQPMKMPILTSQDVTNFAGRLLTEEQQCQLARKGE